MSGKSKLPPATPAATTPAAAVRRQVTGQESTAPTTATGLHPLKDPRELKRVPIGLSDDHTDFLDQLVETANKTHRLRGAAQLSRSNVMRALVDALQDSGLDVSAASSEDELRALVAAALAR